MQTDKIPFYFPLQNGRYEVKPGLFPWETDFGNENSDHDYFQFDPLFAAYREEKDRARDENLDKYYCQSAPSEAAVRRSNRHIIEQLVQQHPRLFSFNATPNGNKFHAHLSGETLIIDDDYQLLDHHGSTNQYRDTFDALASQLQEDLALLEFTTNHRDTITSLHLCFPNHWSAEEKIATSFLQAHQAVPGMQRINARSKQIMHSLLNKGPFVRFAWGLATDNRLNHHPFPPANSDPSAWSGRRFDRHNPELYLRVERQVIHGFAESKAILFSIRTYHYDVGELKKLPLYQQALKSALQSMPEESRRYKGLEKDLTPICDWLEQTD